MKLKQSHIADEWDESNTEDGYWISLKPGYKWDGDLLGCVHTIHEDTKKEAHKEHVVVCNCKDCCSQIA